MEILNQANNGSKQDLSLDFDLGLEHSQFVPETPGSPSPIIGAPHNRTNGRINQNQEYVIEHEYFEMESQEIENASTLNSGSKAMNNDVNSSTKLPLINDTLRSQGNCTVIMINPLDNNVKELINNPVEIVKSTNNSFFNCPEVKDIRVNKRKNILVAEMRE